MQFNNHRDEEAVKKMKQLERRVSRFRVSGFWIMLSSIFISAMPTVLLILGSIPYCWILNISCDLALKSLQLAIAVFLHGGKINAPSENNNNINTLDVKRSFSSGQEIPVVATEEL